MPRLFKCLLLCSLVLLILPTPAQSADNEALQAQVEATERAFAQSMADRDFEAFKSFLADETIFFSRNEALRGKDAVAEVWQYFYEDPEAPFSWEPDTVAVLDSGTLALSSGPVRNAAGERFSTFQSVWRLESDGQWRIVFDKGTRYCEPPEPAEE